MECMDCKGRGKFEIDAMPAICKRCAGIGFVDDAMPEWIAAGRALKDHRNELGFRSMTYAKVLRVSYQTLRRMELGWIKPMTVEDAIELEKTFPGFVAPRSYWRTQKWKRVKRS